MAEHPIQRRRFADSVPQPSPKRGRRTAGRARRARGVRRPRMDPAVEELRREARERWSYRTGDGTRHIVKGVGPTGEDTPSATSVEPGSPARRAAVAGAALLVIMIVLFLTILILKGNLL
ncbi:MAG TPA: hypothetical protein EYP43_03730 [Thermoplasmata archaeon]|nr:hypothetical protein [Thermoplasmata archaeon]